MSGPPVDAGTRPLIDRLDAAVRLGDLEAIVGRAKDELESAVGSGSFRLPDRFHETCEKSYARRLLHRCDELRYTAVVMTWGPGQGTPLHDHAGIWCVECVLEGEMEVIQFDLVERNGEHFEFREGRRLQPTVGEAGCLIPPSEYHILRNRLTDRPSLTLHVYGGEMDRCSIFVPDDCGHFRREACPLRYTD